MKYLITILLSLSICNMAVCKKEDRPVSPPNSYPNPGKPPADQNKNIKKNPNKPAKTKRFPPHWGRPPLLQTKDLKPLPFGYGMGSSTLANWIIKNVKADKNKFHERPEPSKEVKARLEEVKKAKKNLDLSKRIFLENLKGKPREDALELIKEFKAAQKEKHEILKTARKELTKEIRSKKITGDKRVE